MKAHALSQFKPTGLLLFALGAMLACALLAQGQGMDLANRPIQRIEFEGLNKVPSQLVRNVVRSEAGGPYLPQTVEQDVIRLTNLGRFSTVEARVDPLPSGAVELTFVVEEMPLLADVQIVGNKAITDQELLSKVMLRSGDARDPFLIERGRESIIATYNEKGYFVADAVIDEKLLNETGILVYQVREGPMVRVRRFEFKGNDSLDDKVLRSQVQHQTYIPIFQSGALKRETLELDVARIRAYYQNQGYLDVLVGRRIELSDNQEDAVITFLIEEGPRYSVATVDVEGVSVFQQQQIKAVMLLKPGSVYSQQNIDQSRQAIQDMYGRMGYLETDVQFQRLFHEDQPLVDVKAIVGESSPTTVGRVTVRGNAVTQDKVIFHELRGMTPGRRFDRTRVQETKERLENGPFFSEATVTVLGNEDDEVRDVLIEVREKNTGSVSFGAGISSDAGIVGAIEMNQRNFDIEDWPESFSELFSGRAFRGAGQTFNLSIQPGNETSRYSVGWTEPHLFETDFTLGFNAFYFQREREDWNEQRVGGTLSFGRKFGDVWSGSVRVGGQLININDIDKSAPIDVFEVEGQNVVTSLGFLLQRTTVDNTIFPTKGSQMEFGVTQFLPPGDFTFSRAEASFKKFWTLDTDWRGRKSVLSWHVEAGYIFAGDAPTFERLYAGGHATFRGFAYRGVGPRGIKANTGQLGDDPVGGNWLFLTGLQYNVPIFEEFIRGVVFTDQGTVQSDFGFDEWRVSVGAGLRLNIPLLGNVPFAIDLAYPVLKQDGDQVQYLSFDVSLPLR